MAQFMNQKFIHTRSGRAISSMACFVGAWLVFLRASHTGSLQQYGILFVCIYFGFNRLYLVFMPKK